MNSHQEAHASMVAQYGRSDGRTCGGCQSFIQVGSRPMGGKPIAEWGCRVYRADKSHKRNARWAKTWPACGAIRSIG